jgi:glycosyltransferase involved in cell wall biosynthesis
MASGNIEDIVQPTSPSIAEVLKPIPLGPLPERPLVSVLISNYNYEKYLPEALDSLTAQTYGEWEAVICDDGSTDGSRYLIKSYAERDARIRYAFQPNGGQSSALNTAYSLSRGEMICLLDADDVFSARKLEKSVSTFRNFPCAGFAIHPVTPVSARGKVIGGQIPSVLAQGWVAPEALRNGGRVVGLPPTSGMTFRREVTDLLFPIPVSLRYSSDAYLMFNALMITAVAAVAEPLALYRLHGNNVYGTTLPTQGDLVKRLADYRAVADTQVKFLWNYYGDTISKRIDPCASHAYRAHLLAYYLLTGSLPPSAAGQNPAQIISSLPTKPIRMAWRMLLVLPRSLRTPLFMVWQAKYTGKRFLRPLARIAKLTT